MSGFKIYEHMDYSKDLCDFGHDMRAFEDSGYLSDLITVILVQNGKVSLPPEKCGCMPKYFNEEYFRVMVNRTSSTPTCTLQQHVS